MAKRKPAKPVPSSKPMPAAEEVRAAVLHLVELAAAYEGRGHDLAVRRGERADVFEHLGWEPPDEDESFDDDARCLAQVVKLLVAHRRRQRRAQRNAMLEGLMFVLAGVYARHAKSDDSAHDLQSFIKDGLNALGLHTGDEELDALVLDRRDEDEPEGGLEGEASSITGLQGAAEAAKKVLGKLVGRSHGALSAIKRAPHPFALARRPFGRFLPRQARLAYAARLHDDLLAATERTLRLAELGTFDEQAGIFVDRLVEGLLRRLARDARLRGIVNTPDRQAKLAAIEEAERVQIRARASDALEAGPAAVQAFDLPDGVRLQVERIFEARARGSENDEATGALEGAILVAAREVTAKGLETAWRDLLGADLDPAPSAAQPSSSAATTSPARR